MSETVEVCVCARHVSPGHFKESQMTERAHTHYVDSKDFEEVLDAAENANPKGPAGRFVADMRSAYDRYGMAMFLSSSQKHWLENIAGEHA